MAARIQRVVRDKRDDQVYVRIPHELKRDLKKHAGRHLRSLTQDILYLVSLSLHVEEFIPGAWSEDAANDDET